MKSYQVIYKAGYEVQAESEQDALEKSLIELNEEVKKDGFQRFIVEVQELKT